VLPASRTTILDVLRHSMSGNLKFVLDNQLVTDAMQTMIHGNISSLMVKDADGHMVGFVTQRDLLRCIVREGQPPTMGDGEPVGWNVTISRVMTPSRDLVFLTPKDTLEDARALMAVSGKRHIPVLDGSDLLGVLRPKDIARALHIERGEDLDLSAKASYVSTVIPRKGMPISVRMHDEVADEQKVQRFALRPAVCNLPHPHKNSLGEDAFLLGPNMIGVADGVGSWWELDIDPATYARALMQLARGSCVALNADGPSHLRRPRQVLHEAWHQLSESEVVGSSTACLVSLHPVRSELIAANVGDSGFLLLRRATSQANLDERGKQGTLDISASLPASADASLTHHVAFRSPQQLRAFNAPFQLGRAPDELPGVRDDRFETPHDAALVRVPIVDGDVVVLATDGLFDNMPEADVLALLEENAGESEEVLAERIATRAQEMSLDNSVDSPFALLAKDNDIMWGGGRPDDITVIVATVVDTTEHASPLRFKAFAGPGPPPANLGVTSRASEAGAHSVD